MDENPESPGWLMYGLLTATLSAILVFVVGTAVFGDDEASSIATDLTWEVVSFATVPMVLLAFWMLGRGR